MKGVGKPELSITEEETDKIEKLIEEEFEILEISLDYNKIEIYFELEGNIEQKFDNIMNKLKKIGFIPILDKSYDTGHLTIQRYKEQTAETSMKHIILFFATIFTTLIAGASMFGIDVFSNPLQLWKGWPFSLAIMLILGTHELGHYIMSRKRGVVATLPYFIPVPPPFILGTLGAVIQTKSPMQNKKSLLDIGAAGPLLGVAFAIPVTLIGLYLSPISLPQDGGQVLELGRPLIFRALTYLVPVGEGGLHPVAFAGWVGFFITFLNLLPVGQLDGGHVTRALLGEWHDYISASIPFILLGMGFYLAGIANSGGEIWIFWGFITFFFHSGGHPPPLNNVTGLNLKRKVLGLLVYGLLIVCFTPIPFKIVGA